MYRAVALAVLQADVDETDAAAVAAVADSTRLEIPESGLVLNGTDVSETIRTPEVTAVSSVVAANPDVRRRLVEMQREIGTQGSLVTEGRDQGTVVFPKAEHKFFLTASVDARARRRHRELLANGSTLSLATVRTQLRQRDERDENRSHAPMKPADDAQIIDTSSLSIADVVDTLADIVTNSPQQ